MLLPALGVAAARIRPGAHSSTESIEWAQLPWRWLPVALLLLPSAIHIVGVPGVATLAGRLPWAPWLRADSTGLFNTPQWGTLTSAGLAGRIAVNAAVGLIVVSVLAFFEELGWRAFLFPRLADRLGTPTAAVVTSLIWACWHIPFTLSGVQHADNVSPLRLALIEPVGIFAAGLFLAFLWSRTGSILLVSLAHGSLNNWGQFAFKFMNSDGNWDFSLLVLVNLTLLTVGLGALMLMRNGPPLARIRAL